MDMPYNSLGFQYQIYSQNDIDRMFDFFTEPVKCIGPATGTRGTDQATSLGYAKHTFSPNWGTSPDSVSPEWNVSRDTVQHSEVVDRDIFRAELKSKLLLPNYGLKTKDTKHYNKQIKH